MSRAERIGLCVGWLAIVGWVGAQLAIAARLPLFSEDWPLFTEAVTLATPWDAFDPARQPLRPFEHLLAWFAGAVGPDPLWLRVPAFTLHLLALVLVWKVARANGAGRGGALAAAALFATFPAGRSLYWVDAVCTIGRATAMLAAWLCFVRYWRSGARLAGMGMVLGFVLAQCCHQSADVLVALVVVWLLVHARGGNAMVRAGSVLRGLRRPFLVVMVVLGIAHAAYVASIPDTHRSVRVAGAIAANVVKASFALLPEALRWQVVEGFRGHGGALGVILAACAIGVLWLGIAVVVWRGSPLARFSVLAVVVDLAPAVLTTGFSQRYAYFSAALVAVALGIWSMARGPYLRAMDRRLRTLAVCLVGLLWLLDTRTCMNEFQAAGSVVERLLAQFCTIRTRVGPAQRITVADLPDVWGREKDIRVFNWGFREAVTLRCCAGDVVLWRTRPYVTSSDVELVEGKRVAALRADPAAVLLEYDAELGAFRVWVHGVAEPLLPR